MGADLRPEICTELLLPNRSRTPRETGYMVHFGPYRAGAALPRRRRCSAGRARVRSVPNWSQMSRARDSSSSTAGLEAPEQRVLHK